MTNWRLRIAALGAVLAAAVLGPALTGGPFVTLDLVVFDRIDVPDGVWGLGTELPRALPLWVVLGLAEWLLVPLMAAALVLAFSGAARLVRLAGAGLPTQALAGALYGLSPFLLTRLGAGHIGVVVVLAVLPWAVLPLLEPAYSGARTLLWSAALAGAGLVGGLYGGVLVAVGLMRGTQGRDGRRRTGAVAAAFLLAQLPWLVPALVAWATSPPSPVGAATFATELEPVIGPLQLVAGDGFWREVNQVGPSGAATAVAGTGLLLLAAVGLRRLPWWRAGVVVAGVGFTLALASWVPGVRTVHSAVAETTVGAPFRESQRLLGLLLVGLAPAAALGVRALVVEGRHRWERVAPVVAVAALLALLAAPALGAVNGRLDPVDAPSSWEEARALVDERPGTVLALPWHRYLDVSFAGGRRALHPVVHHFGGDVVTSSDPELGEPAREATDPREPFLTEVVDQMEAGDDISDELARAGVRWVALAHEVDWERWDVLSETPWLRPVYESGDIDLFEVPGWRDTNPDRPWARGWIGAEETPEGLLAETSGTVWFWPALVVGAGYVTFLAALVAAVRRIRRLPAPPVAAPSTATPGPPPPG